MDQEHSDDAEHEKIVGYTPVGMSAKGLGAVSVAAVGVWTVDTRTLLEQKENQDARVDHPRGSAPHANLNLLFAASILPTRPWRKIFIPRAASFRRDCGRRFSGVDCSGFELAAL